MKKTCENCRWWGDTHGFQPGQGDCQNPAVVDESRAEPGPAVVDESRAEPGQGAGVKISDRDFMTEPHFGCIHHTAPKAEAKTPLSADEVRKITEQVRKVVPKEDAAVITERVVEHLQSLSEAEQVSLLLPPYLYHVIGIVVSQL